MYKAKHPEASSANESASLTYRSTDRKCDCKYRKRDLELFDIISIDVSISDLTTLYKTKCRVTIYKTIIISTL